MNFAGILFLLGRLLLAMMLALLVPLAVAFWAGRSDARCLSLVCGR